MTSIVDDILIHDGAYVEVPGLRGLRVARVQQNGHSLEVIEGAKDVVIPAVKHPSAESGRVLQGSLRFMQDGVMRVLHKGDTWRVEANRTQGPHIVLESGTRVAILREGKSAFDVA